MMNMCTLARCRFEFNWMCSRNNLRYNRQNLSNLCASSFFSSIFQLVCQIEKWLNDAKQSPTINYRHEEKKRWREIDCLKFFQTNLYGSDQAYERMPLFMD